MATDSWCWSVPPRLAWTSSSSFIGRIVLSGGFGASSSCALSPCGASGPAGSRFKACACGCSCPSSPEPLLESLPPAQAGWHRRIEGDYVRCLSRVHVALHEVNCIEVAGSEDGLAHGPRVHGGGATL